MVIRTYCLYAIGSGGSFRPKRKIGANNASDSTTRSARRARTLPRFLIAPHQGEEILIMSGNEIYARIGPGDPAGKRPFGLLARRGLPDDLFDDHDREQAAIDAGDWSDEVGVFQNEAVKGDKRS